MKIRLSDKNDINGIVSLWNEAFGDTEKEIRFFLDEKFIPENTPVIEENGKIASMLFLLEGDMIINKKAYPSYYLYAACTLKEFRGRGFMANLLTEANRLALLRNKDFICLMPGEKPLFDFYEKHGYITAFSKKILTVNRNASDFSFASVQTVTSNYRELRNKAFSAYDYFEWDNPAIGFAFAHTRMYSGKSVLSDKGYALFAAEENTAFVKEFAFAEENFRHGIDLLFSSSDCEKAVVSLPSEYRTETGEYEIHPSAMLYPVNRCSKRIAENLKNAYLGLTLD